MARELDGGPTASSGPSPPPPGALVAEGLTNKVIADRLGTTEKVHLGRVMAKMGAPSLAELVRMVEKLGPRA